MPETFTKAVDWVNFILDKYVFTIVIPEPKYAESIFGFAEFLASVALFLVVMTASDFRYRYRISLTRIELKKLGAVLVVLVGSAVLATDFWYQNRFPVPRFMNDPNNVRVFLGVIFLTYLFSVVSVATIHPPTFRRRNARRFFTQHYHLIHEGNIERVQVAAEELMRSIDSIINSASKLDRHKQNMMTRMSKRKSETAHDFLLLIGDPRFTKIVGAKVPWFAIRCFKAAQESGARLPISQFMRNVGREFIVNTDSAFYQEESGYYSGYFGYIKPVTAIIFGNYVFIERHGRNRNSPFDLNFGDFERMGAQQVEGYKRASLAFIESYLDKTLGRSRSDVLHIIFSSFRHFLFGLHKIAEIDGWRESKEEGRLEETVNFVVELLDILNEREIKPVSSKVAQPWEADIYDNLSRLVYEILFATTSISASDWRAWIVQHNMTWGRIFGLKKRYSQRVIIRKVNRLLIDDINEMDGFPNFKGAKIVGYVLNIMGLELVDRHKGYQREFYPLHFEAIDWVKKNYGKMLQDYPRIADACLVGSISYDEERRSLVKTFAQGIRKDPSRQYLPID